MIKNSSPWVFKSILTEQGDIAYASGAGIWVPLHHGNAGDVLTSGGHGANPAWAAPASGTPYNFFTVNCQSTDIPNNSYVLIARIHIPANKKITIYNAGIYPHGTANLVVELYNVTDTVSVYSTNADYVADAAGLATLATAHEFYVRIRNTSGGAATEVHGFMTLAMEDA